MPKNIAGWDIGGAHLKAACLAAKPKKLIVYQQPCELWKGLDRLEKAVNKTLAQLPEKIDCHVLTMTGELVDLFKSRDDGVAAIISAMQRFLPEQDILVYAGKDGFLKALDVNKPHYSSIASANWLASASLAANSIKNGLFVDIGSTTTDILLLENSQVLTQGYSDYDRLISQELVYTGIIRTPVMAVAQFAEDQGKHIGLMAEYFATMADVYRLTGELDENHDQTAAADGGEKTVPASATRLARMVGCDYSGNELPRWRQFAENIRERQLAAIQRACLRQLERAGSVGYVPLIGAGVGRFLVKRLALSLNRPYLDFAGFFQDFQCEGDYDPADCAPAAAIARMHLAAVSG